MTLTKENQDGQNEAVIEKWFFVVPGFGNELVIENDGIVIVTLRGSSF